MDICLSDKRLEHELYLLHGGHGLATANSSMSPSSSPGDASKVFIHPLLCRVEVARLRLQAVGQVHREAAMKLGLVVEGLIAAFGLGAVAVLLDEALINLPDGLLCGCLLEDGAPQVQVVCGYHLHWCKQLEQAPQQDRRRPDLWCDVEICDCCDSEVIRCARATCWP